MHGRGKQVVLRAVYICFTTTSNHVAVRVVPYLLEMCLYLPLDRLVFEELLVGLQLLRNDVGVFVPAFFRVRVRLPLRLEAELDVVPLVLKLLRVGVQYAACNMYGTLEFSLISNKPNRFMQIMVITY